MTEYFDQLMKMWDKTSEDHIEWQNRAKSMSTLELFENIQRLVRQADEFSEKTKHMNSDNVGSDSTILAAKFKNQYAIHRFLSSVLIDFSARLVERISENRRESQKLDVNSEIKKLIAEEVKKAISEYKKESKKPKKRRIKAK